VSVQAITEVAGKRKHGKTTEGNAYLRAVLAEIVWGMSHPKDNSLSAKSHRLARRIGKTKAIVAVSHTVEVNFSHMITKRLAYRELGANYFDTKDSRTSHQTHGQTFRSPGL
jgi:transposase